MNASNNNPTNRSIHTFTQEDWYGFAGAECFTDNEQPIMVAWNENGLEVIVIVDKNGVGVTTTNDDFESNWGSGPLGKLDSKMGKVIAQAIHVAPNLEYVLTTFGITLED